MTYITSRLTIMVESYGKDQDMYAHLFTYLNWCIIFGQMSSLFWFKRFQINKIQLKRFCQKTRHVDTLQIQNVFTSKHHLRSCVHMISMEVRLELHSCYSHWNFSQRLANQPPRKSVYMNIIPLEATAATLAEDNTSTPK